MAGRLKLGELTQLVEAGEIDTVLVAQTDMQGRLMGKRFHARHFVETAWQETHSCNYLLTVDMEMTPVPGYKSASWDRGYGDYTMKPDLATLRRVPWLPGTALVLADLLEHGTDAEVPISPRAVLKRQIARLDALGYAPMMASELEFFLFRTSFEEAAAAGYRGLEPISAYNEDYHIFQTTKEEEVMRAIRLGLAGADIPVENTKGEADAGQAEVNVAYSDALTMADRHSIIKNAVKEIAWAKGRAVTFMAKWSYDHAGSSCHVHQSLVGNGGAPAFHDPEGPHGMSRGHAPLRGRPAGARVRDHLFPRALRQLVQALHGGHLRADEGRLVGRQSHGGLSRRRRGDQGRAGRMPRRRRRPEPLSGIRRHAGRRHRRP